MAKQTDMSLTGKAFVVLFISYAMLFLYALWFDGFNNTWFFKLTVSYGVVAVVLALVYLVRREFLDDEQMKKDKYMD